MKYPHVDYTDRGVYHPGIECPSCGGQISPSYPLPERCRLSSGFPADMVSGYGGDFLVSERFMRAWVDEGLTGIERFHQVLVDRIGSRRVDSPELRYYLVILEAPALVLDFHASKCKLSGLLNPNADYDEIWARIRLCPECGRARRKHIRLEKWMECYWAYPENWVLVAPPDRDINAFKNCFNEFETTCVLSDRFVDFVRRHGFSNCYALTAAQMASAKWGDIGDDNPFQEICPQEAAKKVQRIPKWSDALTETLQIDADKLVVGDVADAEEEDALSIPVQRGAWRVQIALDEGGEAIEEVILRRDGGPEGVADWRRIGHVEVDAGMVYLRPGYGLKNRDAALRDAVANLDTRGTTNRRQHFALRRKGVTVAVVLHSGYGDGSYAVYADGDSPASAIRLDLRPGQAYGDGETL